MGDRGNIQITQTYQVADGSRQEATAFLYTHWGGSQVTTVLASALKRGYDRTGDPEYLSRIIFQELIGDDHRNTGFGISLGAVGDNEWPIPHVWWKPFGADPDRPGWPIPSRRLTVTYQDQDYTADEFIDGFYEDPLVRGVA